MLGDMNKIHNCCFILFCLLLALSVQHAAGQGGFYSKNLSHRYLRAAEISMYHRVVNFPERTQLFMRLTVNQDRTRLEDLVTTYSYLSNYSENIVFEEDTVDLLKYRINTIRNEHFLMVEIKNPESKKVLVMKILNKITGNDFYFDINIDPEANVINSGIVIKTPEFNELPAQ